MKKKISALLLALLLLVALCTPALAADGEAGFVSDAADLLTREEWQTLEAQAADISQRHGCGVYIVIVEDYMAYGSGEIYDVASRLYNDPENGFGLGDGREGIVLLLSMYARDFALLVHGDYAEYAFNSYGQAKLENAFLPAFGENDWYSGFSGYLAACDEYLTLADSGDPVQKSPVGGILMAVGISCVVALVVCLVLKSKMNTVHRKVEAQAYVAGGLNLTDSYDRFTHTTETVRTIEKKSSTGHSGGGSSGRSGKF